MLINIFDVFVLFVLTETNHHFLMEGDFGLGLIN